MVDYSIVNMVGVSKIGEDMDLKNIAMSLDGAEYEPEHFPGLIFKIKEPKAAFLIFNSGKIVCTGTRFLQEAQTALGIALSRLKEIDVNVFPDAKIEIVNIVASADLKSKTLNLRQVAMSLGLENIEYEPEQFPGLVYRMSDPKVVILIFSTGKVICTGAKNKDDVELAITNLVKKFKYLDFL